MSYYKVKNVIINEKAGTVSLNLASSNLRPLSYETAISPVLSKMLVEEGKEEVIKNLLLEFHSGNFQSANNSNLKRYVYATSLDDDIIRECSDITYDFYREYTNDEREKAEQRLKELLYQKYLEFDMFNKKGQFAIATEIRNEIYYVISVGKSGYKLETSKTRAKTWKDSLMAQIVLNELKRYSNKNLMLVELKEE